MIYFMGYALKGRKTIDSPTKEKSLLTFYILFSVHGIFFMVVGTISCSPCSYDVTVTQTPEYHSFIAGLNLLRASTITH